MILAQFNDVNSSLRIDFRNYEVGVYFISIVLSNGNKVFYKVVKN